jgi:hypothetical protein
MRKCRNGALDNGGIAQIDRAQLHSDRGHRLDCGKLADSTGQGPGRIEWPLLMLMVPKFCSPARMPSHALPRY